VRVATPLYCVAALGASGLLSACAEIVSSTKYTQTKLSSRSSVDVVPGSLAYDAAVQLEGPMLGMTLQRGESCRTIVTSTYRKEGFTERRAEKYAPIGTLLIGLALGGGGVYWYANAEKMAKDDDRDVADVRLEGAAFLTAGALFLGMSFVDRIRLRDKAWVIGKVEEKSPPLVESCHNQVVAGARVTATAGTTAWRATATTDARGKARLDLRELTEEAFAGDSLQLKGAVEGEAFDLSLSPDDTRQLTTTLLADAGSRLAKDREARLRAQCAQAISAAAKGKIENDTVDAEVEAFDEAWDDARERCGSQWTAEHEQSYRAFQARLQATAGDRKRAHCSQAFEKARAFLQERSEDEKTFESKEVLSFVEERCEGQPDLKRLLDAVLQEVMETTAGRARIRKLDDRIFFQDAVGVLALTRSKNVHAFLKKGEEETRARLFRLLSSQVGTIEKGFWRPDMRAQVCATRSLVLSFLGRESWDLLREQSIKSTDEISGARIARALSDKNCK
jgi:hypothetical protein